VIYSANFIAPQLESISHCDAKQWNEEREREQYAAMSVKQRNEKSLMKPIKEI
jgi:hypothetical protein